MESNPRVTVYVPTCNRLRLLKRALDSVFAQTYEAIDIIVIDDGSLDGTAAYLADLETQKPNLTVITNSETRGAPYSRNLAIRYSSSELITGLDDDDYFLPNRVEELVRAYDPEFSFVSAGYYWKYGKKVKAVQNDLMLVTFERQLYQNEASNQVLTERERVLKVGGFEESMVSCQDWELWTRLTQHFGPGLRIPGQNYVIDVSHENSRISNNPRRSEGFVQFKQKYEKFMHTKQLQAMEMHILAASNERISFFKSIRLINTKTFMRVMRYWARSRIPYISKLRTMILKD